LKKGSPSTGFIRRTPLRLAMPNNAAAAEATAFWGARLERLAAMLSST
jgi:hypothetical protein